MSRQEKKTRIRVVPPKLQLRGQDALTGSYPTNVRFSLDGRTGNYKVGYNDVQTVVFGTRSNGTAWQDNLVGYWTMQRSGPTDSVVGDLTFEGEISGSLGPSIYPFLDFNLADPGTSNFDQIGVIPINGADWNRATAVQSCVWLRHGKCSGYAAFRCWISTTDGVRNLQQSLRAFFL